jgi:hypothetical protein
MDIAKEPSVQYGLEFKKNEIDELLRLREVLNSRKQEEVADVDLAEEEYRQLEKLERKFKDWLLADVWTASFFIPKTEIDIDLYPTNATLDALRENNIVKPSIIEDALKVSDQFKFFHFHLEFPEVFGKGGFDCLLGNPPWEKIQPEEKMFFKQFDGRIATAKGSKRKQIIKELVHENPELYSFWIEHKTSIERSAHFFKNSDFPLMGGGRLNTYTLFSERVLNFVNISGSVGYIVPTGICTDDTTQDYFRHLVQNEWLKSLYDFENRKGLFHSVHKSFKFCLIAISKSQLTAPIDFAFYLQDPEDLSDTSRHFSLSPKELFLLNPNTGTATLFRNQKDAEINLKIYRQNPVLINERTNINPFQISLVQGHYNMTADSGLFRTRQEMEKLGASLRTNIFYTEEEVYLPLYEAKMIYFYNHRYGSYELVVEDSDNTSLPTPSASQYSDPSYEVLPRYWVKKEEPEESEEKEKKSAFNLRNWYLGFRDITNSTNERTVIAALVGNCLTGNKLPFVKFQNDGASKILLILGNLCSIPFDYCSRQKVAATSLNFFILKQLPIVSPELYSVELTSQIADRVLRLVYTSESLRVFAESFEHFADPFPWNEKERFQLQCELDAIYAHLYGLEKEEMDYILDTFPIVKRKDIAKYGHYRTKETILELYDQFGWVREEMAAKAQGSE